MYIGEKKIKGTLEQEDGTVQVGFTDGSPDITLNKNLFNNIKSKKKGRGNVTDNVNHYFATKFIWELSKEGMEFYMVDNIAMAMRTLVHNMREELLGKTFNCNGSDSINLKDLVEGVYGKEKE